MNSNTTLLHDLVFASAQARGDRVALSYGAASMTYGELALRTLQFSHGVLSIGLERNERVAVFLEKRLEAVVAAFGTTQAGGTFVPINPLLKPAQVAHILQDCSVRILVTSTARFSTLKAAIADCIELRHVVLVDDAAAELDRSRHAVHRWTDVCQQATSLQPHRVIDSDMAAILYTSGSTGQPKGVVLSHLNMVAGAKAVATYLDNGSEDTLIAALPLSFDAGFSQLTTAFHVGARVVLLNYLLANDLVATLAHERVTGITAVPALYIQLAQVEWPDAVADHLRYFANTGGRMPLDTLTRLRTILPKSKPFLMYGLTEAFRATFLPPEQVSKRPDSIGKAIPNAEILVLREDGTPCRPHEPGELVQRGALVAMGYWNDPVRTAERFRPLPSNISAARAGLVLPEIAVFSGDVVSYDEEGYLYFVGRRDEMIKTSGYRVSPTEVEEVLYSTGLVLEAAAFGIPHSRLGQAIVVVATAKEPADVDEKKLLAACRERLPLYMVPARIDLRAGSLPRNANGKIDRRLLAAELEHSLADSVQ